MPATALGLLLTAPAWGGELTVLGHPEDSYPAALSGEARDLFGGHVALDGDMLMVSRTGHRDASGRNVGDVRVYQRNGAQWDLTTTLGPSDPAVAQSFGFALELDGNTAVIGSARDSAYVFQRSEAGWQEQLRLSGTGWFGTHVALQGDQLIVAAPREDLKGAVHSYVRVNGQWLFEQRLPSPQSVLFGEYGCNVALAGDFLFVGACFGEANEQGISGPGSVYIYQRIASQWVQQARLTAPNAVPEDQFGDALDARDGLLLVGAPARVGSDGVQARGAAYVYVLLNGEWTFREQLLSSNGGQFFGDAVAVTAEHAAVARPSVSGGGLQIYSRSGGPVAQVAEFSMPVAPVANSLRFANDLDISGSMLAAGGYSPGGTLPGLVRIYEKVGGGWQQSAEVREPESAQDERYGQAVAVDGDTALVAAPSGNITNGSVRSGFVQVLVRVGTAWTEQARWALGADSSHLRGFGRWVALSGETALVNTSNTSTGVLQGLVHVFTRSGLAWTQQANLDLGSLFGKGANTGVIQGNTAAIGVSGADSPSGPTFAGAVLVFERTGGEWLNTARLDAPFPVSGGYFGTRLALDGNTLLVKEMGGPVYAYVRSGAQWTLQQRLTSVAQDAGAIALQGDTAFVGTAASSVLRFQRTGGTWSQQPSLVPMPAIADSQVGLALSVSGNRLLVGAPSLDVEGSANVAASAAYLFTLGAGEWTQSARLLAPAIAGPQNFGEAVAQSGAVSLVGVPTADSSTTGSRNVGAAYLLRGDAPYTTVPLFGDGFEGPPTR